MRLTSLALAAACAAAVGITQAEARPYDYDSDGGVYFDANNNLVWQNDGEDRSFGRDRIGRRAGGRSRVLTTRESLGGLGPRPRRWCGWWMRSQRGGGPEFNLAWNWRYYGRPTSPQVGAVVIWRHHVGEIVGRASNGQWIVRSGNDGGRVRERARSVAGAVFRI
jgi:hypothetical protein